MDDNIEFNLFKFGKNMVQNTNRKVEERNLIILGDKGSGKTTIFNNLFTSSSTKENYSPTCGINYNYIRYQSGSKKYILNVYEIGGGIKNLGLIKTFLNEKNIFNTFIILSLDFNCIDNCLFSIKQYINDLNNIIKEIANGEIISELIENKKNKYKDRNSADFKRIKLFPLEMILVGCKYDIFEKIEIDKIKWTCRTLRYFSHLYGISLLYYKYNDSKLVKSLNNLVTSIAFNNVNEFTIQKNDILPLYILYSNDSFNEIGDPKVMGTGDTNTLWEDTFYSIYKRNSETNEESDIDEILCEKYKEPRIDEELKQFERRVANPTNITKKKVKNKKN